MALSDLKVVPRNEEGIRLALGVLKQRFGPKTRLHLITPPRGLFSRRLGLFGLGGGLTGSEVAGAAVEGLIEAVQARALWNRFGL